MRRVHLPILSEEDERTLEEAARPATREDCLNGPRPCPFVGCKHHLYLDVSRHGSIKVNFPDLEPWELAESCALDVADRGGLTLDEVGVVMNLTRERIRQVEVKALAKMEALSDMEALREYVEEGPNGKRRLPKITEADLAPGQRKGAKLSLVRGAAAPETKPGDSADFEDSADGAADFLDF